MRQLLREQMRMAVTREVGFAGDVVDLALFVYSELVLEDGRLAGLLARPVERTLSDETDQQSSNGALHDDAGVRV